MGETGVRVRILGRCVIYVGQKEGANGWYEAQMSLPSEPSSVVRAVKTLWFPSNKIGEVTDEDFELLKLHGHIGEGRLHEAEVYGPREANSKRS